jgi:hypothetical protein
MVRFMSQLIYPKKKSQYPLDRRLVGSQSQSDVVVRKQKYLPLPGIKPWLSSL